jgi:hypothetical protein
VPGKISSRCESQLEVEMTAKTAIGGLVHALIGLIEGGRAIALTSNENRSSIIYCSTSRARREDPSRFGL